MAEYSKLRILIYFCAIFHFSLIFLFAAMGSLPMCVYNIISSTCYCMGDVFLGHGRLKIIFCFPFFEVFLHSVLSVMLAGWEFGFQYYLLILVPVYYNLLYRNATLKFTLHLATFISLVSMMVFILLYHFRNLSLEMVRTNALEWVHSIESINIYILYVALIAFSIIFVAENRVYQDEMKNEIGKLEQLSNIDVLTGMFNRRHTYELLQDLMDSDTAFSVIMGDLDDFKIINDSNGHECGDIVLKNLSEIINNFCPQNSFSARWGGEEFLIVAVGLDGHQTVELAEKIRARVESSRFVYNTRLIKYTITFGVAEYAQNLPVDDLINQADENLYKGKQQGKNCVIYKKKRTEQ